MYSYNSYKGTGLLAHQAGVLKMDSIRELRPFLATLVIMHSEFYSPPRVSLVVQFLCHNVCLH